VTPCSEEDVRWAAAVIMSRAFYLDGDGDGGGDGGDDGDWDDFDWVDGRGLHSSTFQLNLSRFAHTSLCPPV